MFIDFHKKDHFSVGKKKKKVNGCRKINNANINQKKAGVAVLTSDRTDFRPRKSIRVRVALHNDKEVNLSRRHNDPQHVYTSQQSIKIHEMKTELQVEIDVSITIVGNFNIPLYQIWIDAFGQKAEN